MWIYKLTNTKNGKVYVGKTARLKQRLYMHSRAYDTERSSLHRAIKKHGFETFQLDILERNIETEEELNQLEIWWIKRLSATDRRFGYNLTDGGEGMLGRKWPKEARERMSAQRKGRATSAAQKAAARKTWSGRKHSEESKEKMRAACSARSAMPEYRKKLSMVLKGKPKSDKHKESLKAAARRRPGARIVEFNGERLNVVDWAMKLGISKECLKFRLDKGWPLERALTTEVKK